MKFIVEGFHQGNKAHMDVIPNIMGEVLLCLKDANGKTRESAYQLLLKMAKVKNDMTDYFKIIVAALGAKTSHMRSAAVMAFSRLVFEFARTDFTVQALLPHVLKTVIVLFDENSREVIKSVIGFVRVSVAALNKDQLEPLLPEVVGGMMKFNRGKGRFRSKIKIILKRLVRCYGYETITALVPETDTRLLTHMRKLSERAARRKAASREDGHSGEVAFDDLMDSDEDDSDGGRTLMTGMTGFTKMTGGSRKSMRSAVSQAKSLATSKYIRAKSMMSSKSTAGSGPRIDMSGETNGEVLDMLDASASKNVRFSQDDADSDYSDGDDDPIEFDDEGRLVIGEENSGDEGNNDKEDSRSGKRVKVSKFESAMKTRDEKHVKKSQKRQDRNKKSELGSAYKSKKAGGDVQRKTQKFEPYAFMPLDGKSCTKKNRSTTVDKMATVVRGKSGSKRKRR
jgi:ribosomal RNA-processing protein 12